MSDLTQSSMQSSINELTSGEISCNLIHTTILIGQRQPVAGYPTVAGGKFTTMINEFDDSDRMFRVVSFLLLMFDNRIFAMAICTIEVSIFKVDLSQEALSSHFFCCLCKTACGRPC